MGRIRGAAGDAKYTNLSRKECVPPWEIFEIDYRFPRWSLSAGLRDASHPVASSCAPRGEFVLTVTSASGVTIG